MPNPLYNLGIAGGGQLALMLAEAAHKLGKSVVIYTDDKDSPALRIADYHLVGTYDDRNKLIELRHLTDRVMIDWENIPTATLHFLAQLDVHVSPKPLFLGVTQDRSVEKGFAGRLGIPTVPYEFIHDLGCIKCPGNRARYDRVLPGILKTCSGGYDGKRQIKVTNFDELIAAHALLECAPCVLEKKVDLVFEFSIIAVRGHDNAAVFFPPIVNEHVNGILVRSAYREGQLAPDLEHDARGYVLRLLGEIRGPLILAVEFFIVKDAHERDAVLFNEMAPRPHNSGHLTREAFKHSQFDYAVRAMLRMDLPPIEPLCREAEMINLLGSDIYRAEELRADGWKVTDYGKMPVREGRKQGHAVW